MDGIKILKGLAELYDGLEESSDIKIGVRKRWRALYLSAIKGNLPEELHVWCWTFDMTVKTGTPLWVPSLGHSFNNSLMVMSYFTSYSPNDSRGLKTLELEG